MRAEPHLEKLKNKLVERNYPNNLIHSQISKAKKKDKKDNILQDSKSKAKKEKRARLIFTQNEGNPLYISGFRRVKYF